MYQIVRAKTADDNLNSIADYIALDNPYKAISFIEEMVVRFTEVASIFPKVGVKCIDYYCYTYKGYLIFYDINESIKQIEIVYVINSSQYTAYKDFIS